MSEAILKAIMEAWQQQSAPRSKDRGMFYPLTSSSWGDEEIEAATAVLRSGRTTMGEKTLEFEEKFAKYFGVKHAVFVNSGSSANLLATAALTFTKDKLLQPGDEVLVPAVAWATTYFPLYQYGLKIKLVDVDLETLNIDESKVFNSNLMAVNLLGNPLEYWNLPHTKLLIEDNCEAMGAELPPFLGRKQYCGTFGKVGTFSTFFSHHIQTGEGGVVVTDDDEVDQILRCLRSHGWTRELPKENYMQNKGEDEWTERFRFYLPGYNLRPTEMAAAIGICQLQRLPSLLEGRRKNAKIFHQLLADLNKNELLVSSQKPVGNPSYYGFALILRGRAAGKRKELVNRLTENGIETRPIMTGNFLRSPVAKRMGIVGNPEDFSNAEIVDKQGLFVGNAGIPLDSQLEKTFDVIRKYASEVEGRAK